MAWPPQAAWHRLRLSTCCAWCFLTALLSGAATEEPPEISLGACGYYDTNGDVLFHIMDFVAKVALEEGFLDDAVPNRRLFATSIHAVDTYCRSSVAKETSSLILGSGPVVGRLNSDTHFSPVVGIQGCKCSTASLVTANLATSFVVPMVSPSATNPALSDKRRYPYFNRAIAPDSSQGAGIAMLVITFGWGIIQLVEPQEPYTIGVADAVRAALATSGPDIVVFRDPVAPMPLKSAADALTFDYEVLQQLAARVAEAIPVRRVFVVPGQGHLVIPIARAFEEAGLLDHPTAWLTSEVACSMPHLLHITALLPDLATVAPDNPLFASPESMDAWRATPWKLKGMLCLLPLARGPRYFSPGWQYFWTNLTRQRLLDAGMPQEYPTKAEWFADMAKLNTDVFYPLTFDAMTTLFVAISDLLGAGVPVEDVRGEVLGTAVRTANFEGLSGKVTFDAQGDRLAPYEVMNLQQIRDVAEEDEAGDDDHDVIRVGQYDGAAGIVTFDRAVMFADGSSTPPPDQPPPCLPGFEFAGARLGCKPCSRGHHAPTSSNVLKCEQCSPGFFAPREAMAHCVLAPPGSHAPGWGSTGYVPCPPGQYQDTAGGDRCLPCPAGTANSASNATSCEACGLGRYTDGPGASLCAPCPIAGSTTKYPRAESVDKCVCPEGMHLSKQHADAPELLPQQGSPVTSGGWACRPCGEGLLCVAYTLDPPLQAAGYHVGQPASRGEDPPFVVKCQSKQRCPRNRTLGTCPDGREGMGCNFCRQGFYPDTSGICFPCHESGILYALVPAAITVGVIFIGICLYTHRRGLLSHQMTAASSITCSLTFNAVQTFGSFNTLVIDWRSPIYETQDGMRQASLGLELFDLGCLFSQRSVLTWYLCELLLHPVFACLLALCFQLGRMLGWPAEPADLVNLQGTVLLITYLRLAMSSLLPVQCSSNPDGSSSMYSNRGVICFEDSHLVMLVMSMLGVLVYVVGMLSIVIWASIQYPSKVQHSGGVDFLLRFQWLFRRFSDKRFYFCIFWVLRNLLVAAFPVLFVRAPVLQVILVELTIVVYAALQVWMWPWRSRVANFLDMNFAAAAIIVMSGGCMMMEVSGRSLSVLRIFLLSIYGLCFLALAVIFFSLIFFMVFPKRPYAVYLSHHQSNTVVLARWFKLELRLLTVDRIFSAVDNLSIADSAYRIAAYETKNIVVLLTREALWRVQCAGEIASAMSNGVNTVLVKCDDAWQQPSDDDLRDLHLVWPEKQQVELGTHGISIYTVKQAYVRMRELPVTSFWLTAPPSAWKEGLRFISDQCEDLRPLVGKGGPMVQRMVSTVSVRSHGADYKARASSLLILADYESHEAIPIAMVLQAYLEQRMEHHATVSLMDACREVWIKQVSCTGAILVLLTHSVTTHEPFMEALQILLFCRFEILAVSVHQDHSLLRHSSSLESRESDEEADHDDVELTFESQELGPKDGSWRPLVTAGSFLELLHNASVRFSPFAAEHVQNAEVSEVLQKLAMLQMGSHSPKRNSRFPVRLQL